jgi:16S rRNA processing protein RimM
LKDLVLIARVRKIHGLKGELELETFTWDESRFARLSRVLVRMKDGKVLEHKVHSVHEVHKGLLLTFEGVVDRTQAETFRGAELLIPESEREPLPEGRAYYDEIEGMTVIDDETGTPIGTVKQVLDMPAGEVFVLNLDGEERLVANPSEEVKSLDTTKKELRVKLLEEY